MTKKKLNKNLVKQIFIWLSAFSLILGIYSFLIPSRALYFQMIYIISISITLIYSVKQIRIHIGRNIESPKKQNIILILTLLIIHILTWLLVKDRSLAWSNLPNSISFIHIDKKFLFIKPLELVLQQTLLFWLVIILKNFHFSRKQVYITFALLFGINHIWLGFVSGWTIAIYLTISAIIASYIFPRYMLKKDGFYYSYTIHLLFYIMSAIIFHL